jgi:hypothetical protein
MKMKAGYDWPKTMPTMGFGTCKVELSDSITTELVLVTVLRTTNNAVKSLQVSICGLCALDKSFTYWNICNYLLF